MEKEITIGLNETDIDDVEIIRAVETAHASGHQPVMDNWHTEDWRKPHERIRYSELVEVLGERVICYWNPTEDGFRDAEECGDESLMCNWDEIDRVEFA